MNVITFREGDTEAILYPGKDIAVVRENGRTRTVEVTRWVFPDNLPPVPVLALGEHSEDEVAQAILGALK